MQNKRLGFTLIELLVVVLIIGILAAIAVPQYQKVVWKSRAVETIQVIDTLKKAMNVYRLEHPTIDNDLVFLGTSSNTSLDIEPSGFVSCDETTCSSKYWRYDAGCDTGGLCWIYGSPLRGEINEIFFYNDNGNETGPIATYCDPNETQEKNCKALESLGIECEPTGC